MKPSDALYNEDEIIQACQNNDRKAQEFVFKKFGASMMGVCSRYTRTREDAQDLLQDGFIKVFTKISTFKRESALATWMTRIFVNTALTNLKKGANKYVHLDIDELELSDTVSDDDSNGFYEFNRSMLEEMEAEDVLKHIQMLPDKYRIIINMYCVDNFSHKQIADTLHITEGTSKSQLSRGRKLLMAMLEKKKIRGQITPDNEKNEDFQELIKIEH